MIKCDWNGHHDKGYDPDTLCHGQSIFELIDPPMTYQICIDHAEAAERYVERSGGRSRIDSKPQCRRAKA